MITSESDFFEIEEELFNQHSRELNVRLFFLLNTKYRRSLLPLLKSKAKLPSIFGTLKVGDITLYALACGLYEKKSEIGFSAICAFAVMKDLRKQTRIMVIDQPGDSPSGVIYETHAISRYKERLGLPADMDFVDVCKHMCSVGLCCSPRIIDNLTTVHGSNTDNRETFIMCANGVFMGRYSMEKHMHYAETFLSPNELREDQSHLNPLESEGAKNWSEYIRKTYKGEIPFERMERASSEQYFCREDGEFKEVDFSEKEEKLEKFESYYRENPEIYQAQIEHNRKKANNRLKRKGYK